MIRDRGTKKWTAMMLPEHVEMLREHKQALYETPRPQLDEWDLATIQETIEIAMKRNVEVTVKVWSDGEFIYQVGKITWIDFINREIEMEDALKSFTLRMDGIVDVTIVE